MSNVRKNQRHPNKFSLLDKCLKLYDHTMIVINGKMFDKTYKSLIDRIDNEASLIYHCCRVANNELDNRVQEEARQRLALQKEAIDHCMWLKTDILLSERKFHLRASKVGYWNGLANEALSAIKAWHKTELENYKATYGL